MAYIDVIPYEEAEGELKEIYEDLIAKRGKLADVHMIQSLNPQSIVDHMQLYMTIMFGKSPIRRAQREMIAVVVSAANNCEYCQTHHGTALNHFWKNEERVASLSNNFRDAELNEQDLLMAELGWKLTTEPNFSDKEEYINRLKELGLSDRAVLDITLIISYFNFVNRIVLGLGVDLEEHKGAGFVYD